MTHRARTALQSLAGTAAVLTLLALALLAGAAPADDDPQAAQRRLAQELAATIAAGDADALAAFFQQNLHPDLLARRGAADWQAIAAQLTNHAGLEVEEMRRTGPTSIEMVGASPTGMTLTFELQFEEGPPHRIANFGIAAEDGDDDHRGPELPPFEVAAGADEAALAAALGAYFERLAADGLFSGTALVAVDGRPVFTTAHGLADRRWGIPNRPDTRFDIGSINKSFTQIAVAQLVAAGRLSFDDTIAQRLPDYPNREVAEQVTVRHLLRMTSGLPDIFNQRYRDSSKGLYRRPADYFPLFADQPLDFEPGSRRQYSNSGYMVLGAIIEAVAGQPYTEYVAEHIFTPAGMSATGFFARDEPVPDIAVGYTRGFGGDGGEDAPLRSNLYHLPAIGSPAGSAQATVGDLLRFDRAVRGHRLLTPAYTGWYFGGAEPAEGAGETAGEDAGGDAELAGAGQGIAGGAPGVSAVLQSDGVHTVVILSNYDPPITEAVARAIWRPLKESDRR